MEESCVNQRQSRVEDLHLDRVIASQPEIGPTPPDGGYGWLIVVSAAIYNVIAPSVLMLYGFIILKSLREEDHEEGESLRIWDLDVALVPVIMTVIRLLLESWCRAVVKIFNMPRFTALSGLCLSVAGVLLSSYSTSVSSNDHIVSVFAGIFVGTGSALTGQQSDVIITHYFREKLTLAQRITKVAPCLGNVVVPLIVGYLCTVYSSDVVVMIYGAILMQNCFFLAAFTRPVYIERVIRTTYNMLRDAVEDDDEVIFSNQNSNTNERNTPNIAPNQETEDANDVVVFNSRQNAREVLDPDVERRESDRQARFSSDFSTMYDDSASNRFSSDFGSLQIGSYSNISGYQELASIDRDGQNPQPLYRETTVDAPPSSLVFTSEMTLRSARRTASLKKNFITVVNMLQDINFYLYTLIHLCTTYSGLVLCVVFPPMMWEENTSMNIWSIASFTSLSHGAALCFVFLCIFMPNNINEKTKLCAFFCVCGAIGFYATCTILQQSLYNSTVNEFDSTATVTTANTIVAATVMLWAVCFNYTYKTCFFLASLLQTFTAFVFLLASFRRRR
ncbi:unnamed protein product [Leptidea sinapis]|uniref:Major facilitator superfamily (MFS) profile domain-containing protein n=1 Tax=Leptidea sinapis TaxID=189913 RepID=A0A5E4PP67_9NEOP|nr:unnamed protein product [Leptidea sinapis]